MLTRTHPPESLRIQLEGALETLEQGERRYAALVGQLGRARWKRRLRQDPGLLREVRAHESVLAEALARVERKAQQEHWPHAHPVRVLLRVLGVRHHVVASLARERLASLGSWKDASLGEVLAELEARVLEPAALPPRPSEEVRLQVFQGQSLPMLLFLGAMLAAWGPALYQGGLSGWASALLGVSIIGAVAAGWRYPPLHRFWLTRRRLVWQPRFGEAVEVPLSSLSPEDVELLPEGEAPWGVALRVRGPRPLAVRSLRLRPSEWSTLLHALPAPEGKAPPGEDFVLLRASLVSGSVGQSRAGGTYGLLVLTAGFLAFVPARYSESLGPWAELLTRVWRMAPQALERFVWMAVDREQGAFFNLSEVHATPTPTNTGPGYRFILNGKAALLASTEASQQEAIARILQRWRERLHRP